MLRPKMPLDSGPHARRLRAQRGELPYVRGGGRLLGWRCVQTRDDLIVIRAFLVDREKLSVERLSVMLAKLGDIMIAGTAASALGSADEIAAASPDVLFVEAEQSEDLPAIVHKMLENGAEPPCLVLVSTSNDMAVAGFNAGAIDYLVKPFPQERLAESLRRVRRACNGISSRPQRSAASEKNLKPGLY